MPTGNDAQSSRQVKRPHTSNKTDTEKTNRAHGEILSVHLNDMQTLMYGTQIGNTKATALFDSGVTLSCISKCFYDRIQHLEPD